MAWHTCTRQGQVLTPARPCTGHSRTASPLWPSDNQGVSVPRVLGLGMGEMWGAEEWRVGSLS